MVGDIVIITDENTIDNSSGSVLAGLTLKAPSSFGVVSPVTSLTTALIASGETLSDAESQIKTALGLNDQISLNSFNPFNDVTSNDSIEYEKTSQQVIAIVNALSEIEVASGVSKQGAMSHAGETSMARYFGNNRGKALSIATLGGMAGVMFLPYIVLN